jgi:hypothetical protein
MNRIANKDIHSTITTHYIDGAFVESHGREVMHIISPTRGAWKYTAASLSSPD